MSGGVNMQYTPDMHKRLKQNGVNQYTFINRLKRGWAIDAALDTPPAPYGKNYYVVKNGTTIRKKIWGTSAVATLITKDCGKRRTITKNQIIGQVYRKGYALFHIGEDIYGVAPKTGE